MSQALSILPEAVRADLRRRHGESHRAYHGWSHIEALLALHAELAAQWHDAQAVLLAIAFHDAVYDPRGSDNELQSAALLRQTMAGRVPPEQLERAERLVLATQAHALPPGLPADEAEDMAHFLDMDLSILGADTALFERYEAGVRHEYAHVPGAQFRQGRAAVLQRFAARDRLYFSAWGHARFETQARANIVRSLAALAGD